MRSIWKGHIRFSLVTIPIRIYNAVDTAEQAIRFNQLQKDDNGPDGAVAAKTYSLLSQALKASGKVGVGKVVLRDREEVVMIAPMDGGIMLHKLRNPIEVRKMESVPQIEHKEINKDELKLSISLVESMASTLKELDLTDRYSDALREMIEAKIAGRQVVTVAEEEKPVVDIMTALRQSIEQTKARKKPMEKAKGEKKPAVEVAPAKPKKQK